MAILIEEDKGKKNYSNMIGWVVLVIIALVGVYYIFFAPATPGVVTPPASLQEITAITQINFNPTTVTNNPTFQNLKQTIQEPTSTGPTGVGKTDPFLP